jgi:hypothetical protein
VTVTFSNADGNPLKPVISFVADWSMASGNQGYLSIRYSVKAPSATLVASSVSITAQVANVDPDNQFSSFIDDAGAILFADGSALNLAVSLWPPETGSPAVTVTQSRGVSYDSRHQGSGENPITIASSIQVVNAIVIGSWGPNIASVSQISNGLTANQ